MHRRNTFFSGRNGPDALSMTSCVAACVLLIVSMVLGGQASNILWLLALVFLVASYFRILSRNIPKRQRENQRFLELMSPVTDWWHRKKLRRRQKNLYCFFKCPQCGTVLRVPKGKGHSRITCKNCSHVFERNS